MQEQRPEIACACGCGTMISALDIRGVPRRFSKGHNRKAVAGSRHPSWRGGKFLRNGYVQVYVYKTHIASGGRNRYMPEHRIVMSEAIGRPLNRWETVHHINGVRTDNRLENLQIRQGHHGSGVSHRCLDCGSHNVEPTQLLDTNSGQTHLVVGAAT